MNAYTVLASFYDRLNSHVDYAAIEAFLQKVFDENGILPNGMLLDLACGTGRLTLPFQKKGYDMIAADLSEDMLMTARERADEAGVMPLFLCQDMRTLDLYGTVDGGYCCLNSLNYLDGEEDLDKVFSRLTHFIAPNGIFVFDVNTAYKFKTVYGDKTYTYDEDGVFCIWQNETDLSPLASNFELTFFVEGKKGQYRRMEESQRQVYLSPEAIEKAYTAYRFETVAVYGGTDRHLPTDTDEAMWFVIRRIGV